MCSKATLEPGGGWERGGFRGLLFRYTNRKGVNAGRCLMPQSKCKMVLKSVCLVVLA